jgi:hypothetical protein
VCEFPEELSIRAWRKGRLETDISLYLFLVVGLKPLRTLLEHKGKCVVLKESIGRTLGWAGQTTFFSWTKVNSRSVRLEISSSYLGMGGEVAQVMW